MIFAETDAPTTPLHQLPAVADGLVSGADLRASELTAKHASWAEGFAKNYVITQDNALDIVQKETGLVFAKVLEHAGVYKRTAEGKLPKPIPQHLPFTLRYGLLWRIPRLRRYQRWTAA